MATRDSKGRFVRGSTRTVVVAAAPARRAPASRAPARRAPARRAPARRRTTPQSILASPWAGIAIAAVAGILIGRWLSSAAGKEAVAAAKKKEGVLKFGTGAPLLVAGLAASYLSPTLRTPGHIMAGAGALLVGLRYASRDAKGEPQTFTLAGPDLEALAATTAGDESEDDID